MEINIDLKMLAIRESERVEWKEHGDDIDIAKKIVKTIVAFANDLSNMGGGYVVCGAKEGKDSYGFPKIEYTGLSANRLKAVEGKVLSICRDYVHPAIVPIVSELQNPENEQTRILVFTVLASPEMHGYRDKEGAGTQYWVRTSRETIAAQNGILMQLLTKKQKIEYFDHRINPQATEKDIELLLMQDYLQDMGLWRTDSEWSDYISDTEQISEFIPPFFGRLGLDNILRPRNFTILLFGKKKSIARLFTNRHTVLSIYSGKDRSEIFGEQFLISGNIIDQTKRILALLAIQISTLYDKTSSQSNQQKYPTRAVQEAVVNAVVHRDYEMAEPNYITVFSDRIEIRSAGSLHWGVDRAKFVIGKAGAKWRNRCFAHLFNRLKLSQAQGQGISTIINTMKAEDCPAPVFEIEVENVICTLPAHLRHERVRGN